MVGGTLTLRCYIVGRVMIESDDQLLEASALPGRQGRLAFVHLASAPRRVDRHQLADVLWEELPEAWEPALNSIMSKLRKVFESLGYDGSKLLDGRSGSYELRLPVGSSIDLRSAITALDRAEGALRRGDARAAWSDATVASTVFRRRFLPGETGRWVERMRSDLLEYEIRTFDALAQVWLILGDTNSALQAARHAVALAPYRESAHARVMECHIAAGNRPEAIITYNRLRDMLVETMGLSPSARAEELYQEALR